MRRIFFPRRSVVRRRALIVALVVGGSLVVAALASAVLSRIDERNASADHLSPWRQQNAAAKSDSDG